jgi:cytochrome c-type biogenesis protein CcmE
MGKKKFLIGGIILFLAIGYLGYTGFISSATYYYEVNEFLEQSNRPIGQSVRINGTVVPDSIEPGTGGLGIKFVIKDVEQTATMPVVYQGVKPDTFKEGNDVVVEGKYTAEGTFEASNILTKCASKYTPAT